MSRTAKHGFEWIRHRSSISSAGRRQGAMCVMQFMGQGATFTRFTPRCDAKVRRRSSISSAGVGNDEAQSKKKQRSNHTHSAKLYNRSQIPSDSENRRQIV